MVKTISVKELDAWKSNYKKEAGTDGATESAIVSLDVLKKFIEKVNNSCPGASGVRIYFIRYPLQKSLSYIEKARHGEVSQVSLAFVPTKNGGGDGSAASDYPLPGENSKIVALTVCQPEGEYWDPSTGLCPPKCNW